VRRNELEGAKKISRITIRVPYALKSEIVRLAREDARSEGSVVRLALVEGLAHVARAAGLRRRS
jgi:hypothetical protein